MFTSPLRRRQPEHLHPVDRLGLLVLLVCTLANPLTALAHASPHHQAYTAAPAAPHNPRLVGQPEHLARFWHDQRWTDGDFRACALYAQASLLEALGYDFTAELETMRAQGQREGWYDPAYGTVGLGQPLRTRAIPFTAFGTPAAGPIAPQRALLRLQLELSAGRFVIANVNAQHLDYYQGSFVVWHTLWITGLRLDHNGVPLSVFANDSYRGAAVEYPVDQFLAAWGTPEFNFYAIFVTASHEMRST